MRRYTIEKTRLLFGGFMIMKRKAASLLVLCPALLLLIMLFTASKDEECANSAVNKALRRIKAAKDVYGYCSEYPSSGVGSLRVNLDPVTFEEVVNENAAMRIGGWWRPLGCLALQRLAIIIPFRDRDEHLYLLLRHLLPMLREQHLEFKIVVVEQSGNDLFNKGRLMNAAFEEEVANWRPDCLVFHDVDLIPEDGRNMYSCDDRHPTHMSPAVDTLNYTLPYPNLIGGVLSMRTEIFISVNGFSNMYWGWGAEDDDMAMRLLGVGYHVRRPPHLIGRYKMIKHKAREPRPWAERQSLLKESTQRRKQDGIRNNPYKVIHRKELILYTHLLIEVGPYTFDTDDNSRLSHIPTDTERISKGDDTPSINKTAVGKTTMKTTPEEKKKGRQEHLQRVYPLPAA